MMPRSQFEKLKMNKGKKISNFNAHLLDMVNEANVLDSPDDENEPVDKVLRSLTPKFHMKLTTLEELPDTTNMKLDALVGSQTYEMKFKEVVSDKKINTIGLAAELRNAKVDDENDEITMLTDFGNVMRKFRKDK